MKALFKKDDIIASILQWRNGQNEQDTWEKKH